MGQGKQAMSAAAQQQLEKMLPNKSPLTSALAAKALIHFHDLPENPVLELLISSYGGHCSFLKNWNFDSAAEDLILERLGTARG